MTLTRDTRGKRKYLHYWTAFALPVISGILFDYYI